MDLTYVCPNVQDQKNYFVVAKPTTLPSGLTSAHLYFLRVEAYDPTIHGEEALVFVRPHATERDLVNEVVLGSRLTPLTEIEVKDLNLVSNVKEALLREGLKAYPVLGIVNDVQHSEGSIVEKCRAKLQKALLEHVHFLAQLNSLLACGEVKSSGVIQEVSF